MQPHDAVIRVYDDAGNIVEIDQIGCEAEGLSQQLKVTPQQGHP